MSLIKIIDKKVDLIIYVFTINIFIFTLLGSLLVFFNKYYAWIISIFVLNIQTILYYNFISWKFYQTQRIYKYYLVSVIITSLLSSIMMWLHRRLAQYDTLYVILILLCAQLASILDVLIYRSIRKISIVNKKCV